MPIDLSHYLDPTEKAKIDKIHNVRPFIEAPNTTELAPSSVIELEAIDLSKFVDGPEGLASRKQLAAQLEVALTTYGFFKLVGHGIGTEQIERLKAVGQAIFELDDNTKKQNVAGTFKIPEEQDRELGVIRGTGYKPRGHWTYQNDKRDNVEFFNVRHFLHDDIFYHQIKYPEFVKYHLDEINTYFKHLHYEVLRKVLLLIDIILELPEGQLWQNHFQVINNDIENSGGGFGRFLMYHPVDEEYKEKTNGTWLRGHTDATALTFILSQPIVSLQIREHETNEWKYVTHTPNALVVNIGDAFKYLSGSYFKSLIHRVTTPPEDQAGYQRSTIIYFCDPSLTTFIDPQSLQSPKLQRLGYNGDGGKRVTFKEWDEEKGKFLNEKSRHTKKEVKLFGRDTLMSLENQEAPIAA